MTVREAAGVVNGNFYCEKGSFVYKLHERGRFSKRRFWELYDSVTALSKNARSGGANLDTARRLTVIYQNILKMLIYHFDKNDLANVKKLPGNYHKYIELLDGAVGGYFNGVIPDEKIYKIKRPNKK